MGRIRGRWAWIVAALVAASPAQANHRAREDPSEPIFTQRAFVERNLELDLGPTLEGDGTAGLETTLGATWVFDRRFQLGLDLPIVARFPEDAPSVGGLGDVGISGQLLLCCREDRGWRFLSVRAAISPPTGDRARDLDGTGGFSFSLLAGNGFTVVRALEDLGVQAQLSYAQQIRPDDEARERGRPDVREKELIWNLAFTQPLAGGRLTPVFEVLGTSVVDAAHPGDEGTRVELGVGFWTAPFPDDSFWSALSLAAGWRFPVTGRRDGRGAGLLIAEWAFD